MHHLRKTPAYHAAIKSVEEEWEAAGRPSDWVSVPEFRDIVLNAITDLGLVQNGQPLKWAGDGMVRHLRESAGEHVAWKPGRVPMRRLAEGALQVALSGQGMDLMAKVNGANFVDQRVNLKTVGSFTEADWQRIRDEVHATADAMVNAMKTEAEGAPGMQRENPSTEGNRERDVEALALKLGGAIGAELGRRQVGHLGMLLGIDLPGRGKPRTQTVTWITNQVGENSTENAG